MKIIDSYFSDLLTEDTDTLRARYQFMSYALTDNILPAVAQRLRSGVTVFLFSGSWKLEFDAVYIEPKIFQHVGLQFHPRTIFIKPELEKLYQLTLKSLNPTNLIILHSDFWLGHRPIEQVVQGLNDLTDYIAPGGQVLCTCPVNHLNFNKLKFSTNDIVQVLDAELVDNSIFITKQLCQ